MYKFSNLILEHGDDIQEVTGTFSREKYFEQAFQRCNQGVLKKGGVKKLAAMIENKDIRYLDFPTWVLDSYVDPSQNGAIPLRHNKWLDVKSIINSSTEIKLEDITYGGFVVDSERKKESSVRAVNVVRSEDVDLKKYVRLLLFKRAANEAMKVIDHKKKRMGQMAGQGTMGGATGESAPPGGGMPPTGAPPAGGGGMGGGSLGPPINLDK